MSAHAEILTRREALAAAAMLAGRPSFAAAAYRPKLAVASYVWTQQFHSQKKTVAEGLDEAFAATRRAGYRRIELMSSFFQPDVIENTLKALKEHRLEAPSVYNGGPMHTASEADKTIAGTLQAAAGARRADAEILNFNPSPKPKRERKSDAELDAQARYVNQLGDLLRRQGMRLALHHHDPEMAENAREWRHLLNNTDPKLVSFCIDVDWVRRGGQDPMALLREAGARLASLHLRNSRQDVWTEEFGEGDIDYRPIADYLKKSRFQGLLIVELAYQKETKVTRPLEENLKLSRRFAEKTFGVSS